jgi:hypothetical protein
MLHSFFGEDAVVHSLAFINADSGFLFTLPGEGHGWLVPTLENLHSILEIRG